MNLDDTVKRAAEVLASADGLFVGAGAGMGVDSGLPDFRGDHGFWKAYPPFEKLRLSFVDLANPAWFANDPSLAWGFYGHRMNLYRKTEPHRGFAIIRHWSEHLPRGGVVFTSNVDGQFQRAGFAAARVLECHGSIHFLQCSVPCSERIWSAERVAVHVDTKTFRAVGGIPRCPDCGAVARPNILMFADGAWLYSRTGAQKAAMYSWLDECAATRLAVLEVGAGTAVPTVRNRCEALAQRLGVPLIRINLRQDSGPQGTLSLPRPAAEALERVAQLLPSFA